MAPGEPSGVAVAGASPASRTAETDLRPAFLRTLVARSGALLDPLIASTHPADLPVSPTYSGNTHLDDRIKRFFPDIYLFTGKTGSAPTNHSCRLVLQAPSPRCTRHPLTR